jgi:hypothetical protein
VLGAHLHRVWVGERPTLADRVEEKTTELPVIYQPGGLLISLRTFLLRRAHQQGRAVVNSKSSWSVPLCWALKLAITRSAP